MTTWIHHSNSGYRAEACWFTEMDPTPLFDAGAFVTRSHCERYPDVLASHATPSGGISSAETIEPAYADRRPQSSLDKYTLKLSAWLKTEAVKSRKQRRTLKQLHLELGSLVYEGSYDRVAAFARRWKVDQLERVNSASKSTRNDRSSGAHGIGPAKAGPCIYSMLMRLSFVRASADLGSVIVNIPSLKRAWTLSA